MFKRFWVLSMFRFACRGLFLFVFGIASLLAVGAAQAFTVGQVAYLCKKNDKLLWVIGPDSYSACPVRIIRNAGGSYRILAHTRGCILPGFGAGYLSRGQEAWVESYDLWSTRASCEGPGQKSQASKPKTYPLKIQNACRHDMRGFVRYKNLSGNWVNSDWFSLPADGKIYNVRGVQTKNSTFYHYLTYTEGPKAGKIVGSKTPDVRREKDGKSYGLSEFRSSSNPPSIAFCKK
jgi:hypothetical protein